MNTTKEIQTPPYYQFFNCAPQMFRDYRTRSVFEYLFSVWLCRTRQGKKAAFSYSLRNISIQACVNRNAAASAMDELCDMGLIVLSDSNCTVEASYFYSVVELYNSSKDEQRKQIKNAFLNGDKAALTKLGWLESSHFDTSVAQIVPGGSNQARWLESSHPDDTLNVESGLNQARWLESSHPDDTLNVESGLNQARWLESSHPDDTLNVESGLNQARWLESSHPDDTLNVENFIAYAQNIQRSGLNRATTAQNIDKSLYELLEFSHEDLSNMTNERKHTFLKAIFTLGCNVFYTEVARFMQWGGSNQATRWLESDHSNKYNKERKEEKIFIKDIKVNKGLIKDIKVNKGNKGLVVDKEENIREIIKTERSEVLQKGGKQIAETKISQLAENPEPETGTQDQLEIVELRDIPADELYAEIKEAARKKSRPAKDNPYRNKPYFPEEAVKKITSIEGLEEEGYKSPVKLFMFNFWGGLYDQYYLEYIEPNLPVDEYGNQMQGEFQNDLDMLGHLIPIEDMARLVAQAWSETVDQIECGFIEFENSKVTLEIDEVPDVRFGSLVDWKLTENVNKHPAFIISLNGFRNIEATDATEVKVPRSKEEKRAFNRTNRHFLACVMQMEDSQLTPIEQAAKSFAEHYLRVDEYYNVYGFMNGQGLEAHTDNILPGWMMQTWLPTLFELGVGREDFYKILNVPDGYKHGADYRKLNSIFVYEEVKRWNEMKGFQSQINQEKLENAILSDF